MQFLQNWNLPADAMIFGHNIVSFFPHLTEQTTWRLDDNSCFYVMCILSDMQKYAIYRGQVFWWK